MQKRYPTALTIAGSDSGGGAGIQADLKTFSALGVFGTSAITAVTAQNTTEVRTFEVLSDKIIRQQLETVLDDITIDAVKTGMLPTPDVVHIVAEIIDQYKLNTVIVDPVMVATTGASLSSAPTVSAIKEKLFPRATLITPNIPEAEALSGIKISEEKDMIKAAEILMGKGCKGVLIKGGHMKGKNATDILFQQNHEPARFSNILLNTQNVHGTGCTLSSAITAYMSSGYNLEDAVRQAKDFIYNAILAGKEIKTGKGSGPVNHFFNPVPLKTIDI